MRVLRKAAVRSLGAVVLVAAAVSAASAANFNIDWLNMAPVPFLTPVPNASVFNLPGVGNVTVTHSIPALVDHVRQAQAPPNGGFVLGPDNYAWTNLEYFSGILTAGPDPIVPVQWTVTYTFPGTVTGGSIYVAATGLGATTSFGGGTSTLTVNQNGTFLGEWSPPGGPWGPTQFTPGTGTFQMQNSVTGAGGQNPHWNTPTAVVRVDDSISSITLIFNTLRGDGVAGTIGFAPNPLVGTDATNWSRVKGLYR